MSLVTGRVSAEEVEEHENAAIAINLVSNYLIKRGDYFFWYMLQRLPVYYVYDTENIAWTDGYAIYIGKKFLEMNTEHQAFVTKHEILHIAFHHIPQLSKKLARASTTLDRNIIRITYNIIQDAIINGILIEEERRQNRNPSYSSFVTPEWINPVIEEDVVKLGYENAVEKLIYMINKGDIEVEAKSYGDAPIDISKENIEKLLAKHRVIIVRLINKKNKTFISTYLEIDTDPGGGDGSGGEQGETGKAGDRRRMELIKKPIARDMPKSQEDIYRLVKEAIDFDVTQRQSSQKSAGAGVYGDAIYSLADIEAKKPEWEAKLTSILTNFISRDAVISWSFINRRAPLEKPGIRYISTPDIHILLDVSGSMLDGTLEKALKRIIYIVENNPGVKIKLYQWSSTASLPQDIDRRFAEDLRRYKKIQITTGGTEIAPALEMALKYVEKKDAVIILTDGYIYDIDTKTVRQRFEELVHRAGLVIFASLGYIPETLPKHIIKVRIEE